MRTSTQGAPALKQMIEIKGVEYEKAYEYTAVNVAFAEKEKKGMGKFADLAQEPNNKYDSKAIAVVLGGKRIGYLYKGKIQDMVNDYLNKRMPLIAVVDGVAPVTLTIAFYQ